MLDECVDASGTEQLSCVIRICNDNLEVLEGYLGMFSLPKTDASTLFEVASDIVQRFSLEWCKCRGQGYDGAATMSGERLGLQHRVRSSHCSLAYFVHCQCHNISLMSKDVLLNSDRKLCDVVTYVKQIITFIRGSLKRTNRLSVILNASSKSQILI